MWRGILVGMQPRVRRPLLAVLALGAAALVGLWSIGGKPELAAPAALEREEPEEARADAVGAAALAAGIALPLDDVRAAVPAAVAAQTAAEREGAPITVRVVAAERGGAPIAGARVSLSAGRDVVARAETDAEGRARLDAPTSPLDLSIESDQHVDAARAGVQRGDEVTVALVSSGSLAGRVEFAGRRGPGEHKVHLWTGSAWRGGRGERTTVLDPTGRFRFDDLAPGFVTVALEAEDTAPVHEPSIAIRGGECAEVTLRVPAARMLAGRVVAAEGRQPLADVRIDARPVAQGAPGPVTELARERVRTGPDGTFQLGPLPPGRVIVSAEAAWGGRVEREVDLLDAAAPPIELALAAPVAVSGSVFDGAGRVVDGALVVAVREGDLRGVDWGAAEAEGGGRTLGRATTDVGGRFRFDALPADARIALVAFAADPRGPTWPRREGRTDVTTGRAEAPPEPVRVTLRAHAALRGLVLDAAGAPLAGAAVAAYGRGTPLRGAWVRTAADGTFSLACADGGPEGLSVRADGHRGQRLERPACAAGRDGFVLTEPIVLVPDVQLVGFVTDPEGNAVRASVQVTPTDSQSRRGGRAFSDRFGRFTVQGLAPGPHRVTARAKGFRPLDERSGAPIVDVGAATEPLRLVLQPTPPPLRGAAAGEVVVFGSDDPVPGLRFDGLADGALLLDGALFRAVGLPVGKARLVAAAPGFETQALPECDVVADRTVDLGRIALRPATALTVRVEDSNGTVVRGARVRLERIAATRPGLPRRLDVPETRTPGRHRLENVPRTTWRLAVDHGTLGVHRGEVQIEGASQTVTVTLKPRR